MRHSADFFVDSFYFDSALYEAYRIMNTHKKTHIREYLPEFENILGQESGAKGVLATRPF
jgi:hypothetical protein